MRSYWKAVGVLETGRRELMRAMSLLALSLRYERQSIKLRRIAAETSISGLKCAKAVPNYRKRPLPLRKSSELRSRPTFGGTSSASIPSSPNEECDSASLFLVSW